ncbi:MAG: hypothetical protein V4515_07370 [Chloroflexota bacterium]
MDTSTSLEDGGPTAARAPADRGSKPRPSYGPSWVNVLASWMEGLPGPTWVSYGAGIAVGVLASSQQVGGNGTPAQQLLGVAYYGALPFATLALIHRLDGLASRALSAIRPMLQTDDDEFTAMRRELTIAPARPAWILLVAAFVMTIASFIIDPVGSQITGYAPLALALRTLWEGLITAIFLILIYHTIRQLRLISSTIDRVATIDLFDQAPLYAMSRLTSTTAIGLILLLLPSLFLLPTAADVSYVIISIGWYSLAVLIAGAAFILPLRGVHDRLVRAKRDLQGEVGRRLSATLVQIHDGVDARDASAMDAAHRALSTLIAERDLVNRIPTWPWSTGALTGFLSAVLLPIALFIAQRALGQFI